MYADAARDALTRLRQGYSQEELATLLGTSAAVVRSWEKGRRRPSGPVRMAILMLEGLIKDWPEKPLWSDDWRWKLWGYPPTAVITSRKGEEQAQRIDDYLTQFEASTREAKIAVIRNVEKGIEKLKEIAGSSKTILRNQVSIAAEVAGRWARMCREFVRSHPEVDVRRHAEDMNGRVEADGSLTMFAPLPDGSELTMRVEPNEWERSN